MIIVCIQSIDTWRTDRECILQYISFSETGPLEYVCTCKSMIKHSRRCTIGGYVENLWKYFWSFE